MGSSLLEALSGFGIGLLAFDADGRCLFSSGFIHQLVSAPVSSKRELVRRLAVDQSVERDLEQWMVSDISETKPISIARGERQLLQLERGSMYLSDTRVEVVLVRDVSTELDQQRQMTRLNRLATFGQVAAGAAHEFNNNLTSVLGWAQIARQNAESGSPAASALDKIEDNATKAKQIFTKLLDKVGGSQTENGERRPVSPVKMVEDALTLLQFELRQARIAVRPSLDTDEIQCLVDEDAIGQVLVNIIRNAIDAMRGGGHLDVEVTSSENTALVSIRDDGPGMPMDVVSKVFSPFYSTKRQDDASSYGGTGLGLTVSLDIIRQHGGDIVVESAPGAGTAFTISLPLANDGDRKAEEKRESRPTIPPGALVLVVDDEPDVGEMIQTSLELQGVSVLSVSSGDEALTECERLRFDAAFLDYSMPGISGHDLGKKILSIQPHLPIIFMSGLTVTKNSIAEEFIKKPFDLDEIRSILHRVLKRRKDQESGPA